MDDTVRFNYQQLPDTDEMSVSWTLPKNRELNTDDILSIIEKLVGFNIVTKRLSHKDISDPKFCNLLKPEHSVLIQKYLDAINTGMGEFEIVAEDKNNRYVIYVLCQILGYKFQTIARMSLEELGCNIYSWKKSRKLGVRIFK